VGATVVVIRILAGLGVALMLTTAAWGQNRDQLADRWFHVSWQPRTDGVPPTIGGRVHNDSPYRVTDVHLQVQGLNAEGHEVGQRFAWALGDIPAGGETSFVVETMPGAVDYRISVHSFDIVSVGQSP
jgi:hypothetical protein